MDWHKCSGIRRSYLAACKCMTLRIRYELFPGVPVINGRLRIPDAC